MAIGRFQVMATLQAARALLLGLPEPSAKAWGLNRAIFYAAAKRGFRGGSCMSREGREGAARPQQPRVGTFRLGDDMAFQHQQAGTLYFTIGGQVQTEKEFARQVEHRFEGRFDEVWKEALALVRQHDRSVLLSQQAFYEQVYKPRRDVLALKWSELVAKRPVLGVRRKVAKTR